MIAMTESNATIDERDAKRRAIAEARAAVAAGQVVSHKKMVVWLESWGTQPAPPRPSECE